MNFLLCNAYYFEIFLTPDKRMVVRNLESYVVKTPGLTYPHNIKNLINNELSDAVDSRKKPVIVFDASSAAYLFHPEDLSCWCNGQLSTLKTKIEKFVKNIISLGAYLVVVLRGNEGKDLKYWFEKEKSLAEMFLRQFENVRNSGTIDLDIKNFLPFAVVDCVKTTLASIKNDDYMVFCSTEDVHKEVVGILRQLNGFAVIGTDSNYLIYEGIKKYIWLKSVNLETLDCIVHDRQALLEHLRLQSHHLPLFASLRGNDIIDFHFLLSFHKKISFSHPVPMIAVADVIRNASENPYSEVEKMVRLIEFDAVNEELVKKSLDMYLEQVEFKELPQPLAIKPDFFECDVLEIARLKQKSCLINKIIVKLLGKREIRISVEIENLLEPERSTTRFLKLLRKRIYGILFFEHKNKFVKEYYVKFPFSNNASFDWVAADLPRCKHPGLVSLWTESSVNMKIMRWDLFSSSVSRKLDQYTLRYVPPKLLFPVVALHHLENEVQASTSLKLFKKDFEIKAFLTTAMIVCFQIDVENFEVSVPDLRALDLSSKFLSCCYYLALLNQACGLFLPNEYLCMSNYFDGPLFQHVYEKLKIGTESNEFFEGNIALEACFSTLLDLIMSQ